MGDATEIRMGNIDFRKGLAMTKKPYNVVLKEALNQPANENCELSTDEIQRAIAAITQGLAGPMSNDERLMLVSDRSELRATLKKRTDGK